MCFDVRMKRGNVLIRHRDTSDLDACVRALAEVHKRDQYPMRWPADPAEWLSIPAMLEGWVAELDGRVVGHVVLCAGKPGDATPPVWQERTGTPIEDTAVVSRLFVDPAARGYGVGALLMTEAVRESRARGLQPLLEVLSSDVAATALYERLGWELLGTVEQQWHPGETVLVRCYAAGDPVASVGAESSVPTS